MREPSRASLTSRLNRGTIASAERKALGRQAPQHTQEQGKCMTAFESLISDFAQMTGLPLSPDERGGCALETDGTIITIQYRAEADDIVVFSPVTDSDAGVRPSKAMLEKALSLAFDGKGTSGAFLGLFGVTLILSVHLPMQGLDAESLGVKLTAFSDAALSVKAEIAAVAAPDGGDGEERGGEVVDASKRDLSEFLRV